MTLTDAAPTTIEPARPVTAPPVRARRRRSVIAFGILLVLAGALTGVAVLQSATNTVTVFVTRDPIHRGERIDADDLAPLQLAGGQPVDAYRTSDPSMVVGMVATVDLPPGSLLTPANTAASVGPPDGQSVVGVPLRPGQLPAAALSAGDRVRLVATAQADATGRPATDTAPPVDAVVSAITVDPASDLTVVDVLVPSTSAPALAGRAAAGTLALVLDPAQEAP